MTAGAWQPDPTGRHELRWWDGAAWTDHVSDHGVTGVDPLATLPPPTPGATAPIAATAFQPHPTDAPPTVVTPVVGAPAPSRNTKVWLIAAAVGVAALVGGLVLLTGGDDDKTGAPATQPSGLPPSTTEPSAVSTTASPTTTSTEPATTTTLRPATADDLVAALPSDAELPAGWISSGDPPYTVLEPASGPGMGFCGGDNAAQRAVDANALGVAYSPDYQTPEYGGAGISLYAFPTEQDATAFMASAAEAVASCPDGYQYQMPEGIGEGLYDGFGEGYGDDATWNLSDTATLTPMEPTDADERFTILQVEEYFTLYDNTDYGGTSTTAVHYERHGTIVMVVFLGGECCQYGYSDLDPTTDYQPTEAEVSGHADWVRPGVVQRLTDQGVL